MSNKEKIFSEVQPQNLQGGVYQEVYAVISELQCFLREDSVQMILEDLLNNEIEDAFSIICGAIKREKILISELMYSKLKKIHEVVPNEDQGLLEGLEKFVGKQAE